MMTRGQRDGLLLAVTVRGKHNIYRGLAINTG